MINENELAKELTGVLDKDVAMPKAAALHLKPNGGAKEPTFSDDIDRLIEKFQSAIRGLEMIKGKL